MKEIELDHGPVNLTQHGGKEEEAAEEEGGRDDPEDRDEILMYQEAINSVRRDLLATRRLQDSDPFYFDRATQDLTGLREQFAYESEEKLRRLGVVYDEDTNEVQGTSDQTVAKIEQHTFIEKEDVEETEETWQGLQDDIYSNLRDDRRSQYDQARSLMKLNQQLRVRLI